MAKSSKRDALVMLVSEGIHEECNSTREECGAGESHDIDANNVVDRLVEADLVTVTD
jgi:hypothetical protein